ncbi:MAG: 4Fe-4S binding protein [Armatimonadota bacterium]
MQKPGVMLKELLSHVGKKPATVLYPFVKVEMPPKFRGKLKFHSENCIGCNICMRDCPANAIKIIKIEDKKFKAQIELGQCIYCGQCVDSCPKNALSMTDEFELAQIDPQRMTVVEGAE